jgi:glycosyltransferase involved in cell wall biosynthesis
MKISIITVSFNSSKTIADTINSVRSQSYRNFEHIIIDGNSTDDTVDIIKHNSYPNLKYISEPDAGIYDAMNKGLQRAKGDIIGFLNSDDFFYDRNALSNIAHSFGLSNISILYADLAYIDSSNLKIIRLWKSNVFVSGMFSRGWAPAHPTFYFHKSVLDLVPSFDLSFKLASDFDFMMRCLEINKFKSLYLPNILVSMRLGGATNSSLKNIYSQNIEIIKSIRKNNIRFNLIKYILFKIFSRVSQYLKAVAKRFLGTV